MAPTDARGWVRVMSRQEARTLQEWLVAADWDEGEYDADVLYDIDPDGFWAILDDEGSIVGGLSIVASTESEATISHFYVRPEVRGRGYARRALPRLLEIHGHRIHDDVGITNFCWPRAVEASAQWGFAALHEEIRMVRAPLPVDEPEADPLIVDARAVGWDAVIDFDESCSGRRRDILWRRWLSLPGATSLALLGSDGRIVGLGSIRPSALGCRIGPLTARASDGARRLLERLTQRAAGQRIALDVPVANPLAEPLARSLGFAEDFRTVRTVWGRPRPRPWSDNYATVMLHLD